MEQRYTVALLFLLASCTKDVVIQEYVDYNPTTIYEWSSISERYSSINETTSYFKNQEYVTGYLSAAELRSFDTVRSEATYSIFGQSTIVSDFNGDDKQDLLAHAISFSPDKPYSFYKGKIIFVDDVRGRKIKQVYDSDYYFGVTMAVNDFNNDGKNDVLISSHDTKQNTYHDGEDTGGFQDVPMTRPTIATFNNGLVSFKRVGEVQDTHAITSGDVNNDGLIDFIQFPIPGEYNGQYDYYSTIPSVSLNLGNLNFDTQPLIPDLQYDSWHAHAYELFDINNDSFLDIVVGWEIGVPREQAYSDHYHTTIKDAEVLLGNGSGYYSQTNSFKLLETSLSSTDRHSSILGFGFSDFGNDNDIDIFITTTREEPGANFESGLYYDSYYILAFENNSNQFNEVMIIDQPVDETQSTFTNFYKIMFLDLDVDGDYDLMPFNMPNFGQNYFYISNLHWINNGDSYLKSW